MHRQKWYEKPRGMTILQDEKALLDRILKTMRRNDLLQIGGPHDDRFIENTRVTRAFFLDSSYQRSHQITYVQADLDCFPIRSESMDVVLLIHALEFSHNPNATLQEAYRVLKPNGSVIIFGFNPWSLWRLWSLRTRTLYSPQKIRKKLLGLGCAIELHQTLCFYPQFQWAEMLGQLLFPYFGTVYAICAVKNMLCVTPLAEKYVTTGLLARSST